MVTCSVLATVDKFHHSHNGQEKAVKTDNVFGMQEQQAQM